MTIQLSGIVRDRSFANTEIELIGDVQIDFILNEDNSLKAKVFKFASWKTAGTARVFKFAN